MERLVYLNTVDDLDAFLEHAAWHNTDGIEVDISDMNEAAYHNLRERLVSAPVRPRSLHYERTNTISMKEWSLFESQLQMLAGKAKELGCESVSVHPPRIEIETANTVKELQEFVEKVDVFADELDVRLAFELTGFMKDPQMINAGFADLADPSIGVMVDMESIVDGIDPLELLQKLDVDIFKVRIPMSLAELDQDQVSFDGDVAAVATSIE